MVELITDWIVSGIIKAYSRKFRIWPETICQIMNIIGMFRFLNNDLEEDTQIVKLFEVIIFIRMTKLLTLLYEVQVMRIIIETMRNLMGPLNNLIAVMFTIFYVFG